MAARGDAAKSDDELRREVEQRLQAEPDVDARRVVVSVADAIVTLTGEVRSYTEKWQAERAVEQIPGIRGIANEIEVRGDTDHADSDLARRAVRSLRRNMLVPANAVTVRVENAWIVLTGEVGRDLQRRAAERAVRGLPGVRGVENLVRVRPRAKRGDVGSR
jgi:osmotically-inducible protein OsmY